MDNFTKTDDTHRKIIVVLGMHRSGTSTVTRGLRVLGASLGENLMPPAAGNNEKGFFEDIEINALNVDVLHTIGSEWFYLTPISPYDLQILREKGYIQRAVELLRKKIESANVFAFKDPRISKLLPFWNIVTDHLQLNVNYVVALRHPLSVVKSLEKRDGFLAERSYLLWLGHILESLRGTMGKPRIFVNYDQLIQSPNSELARIAKIFQMKLNPVELEEYKDEFLDSTLRHTIYDPADLLLDTACPPLVYEIFIKLLKVASDQVSNDDPHLECEISEWITEFDRLKSVLNIVDKQHSQLASLSQAVADRDVQLASLGKAVADRDVQLASLGQGVAERDVQLASLGKAVADRDVQLASLGQGVADRDVQLASLGQAVADRDVQLASLGKAVADRDVQLASLGQDVAAQDSQIAGLHTIVSQQNNQVIELNSKIAELDQQFQLMQSEVVQRGILALSLENELIVEKKRNADLCNSASWRFTAPARALLDALGYPIVKLGQLKISICRLTKISLGLAKLLIFKPFFVIRNMNLINLRRFFAALGQHNTDTIVHMVKVEVELDQSRLLIDRSDENSHKGLLKAKELEASYPGITSPIGLQNIALLEEKFITPDHEVDCNAPGRVNIFLPQLDPLIMFGGYIACLQFIQKIQDAGFRVRILLVESGRFDRDAVNAKLASNPALQRAIADVEVEDITRGSHKLVISPNDSFVGYSFWACIKAHLLAKTVGKEYIFFLQEFEPIFHPNDSLYAIGSYVYRLPHKAIFNTDLLADYFRSRKLGVFGRYEGNALDEHYTVFEHALTPTSPPSIKELKQRKTRKLLFYGRPEGHARRNIFEIGILGLKIAIERGIFDSNWEFHGVGTLGPEYELDLGQGRMMKLMGVLPQSDYGAALSEFDIGLSLMLAPHPSILPFEMASAGQIVVTNTYESRTADVLRSISPNIEPCEADPFGVAEALAVALVRLDDYEGRIKGSSFDWARDWDHAFNSEVIDKISSMLRARSDKTILPIM